MSEAILEVVREVLVEIRGVSPEEVVLEASLVDDLGADSLDAIEIIMALEDHYNKEMDNIDVESIKTVADIIQLIQSVVE